MFDPNIMMQSQQEAVPQMSDEEINTKKSRQSSCLENSIIKSTRKNS